MELYVFCLVCVMILGVIVINGIYCFMYLSYPLPGGVDPCPPLSRFRSKVRRRPQSRTRSPVRSPARRQDSAAEVMIPMSRYQDDIDTRLQQTVESPPPRSQLQQSTPRKKSADRLDKAPHHRTTSPRAGTSSSGAGTPSYSARSVTPPSHRSVNVSAVSITPPLARSNTPTRPPTATTSSSSRMKYGQTEI